MRAAWLIRLVLPMALWAGALSGQTVQPDTNLSPDEHASRFLAQATFGPTTDSIAELRGLGNDYNAWIDREVAKPATLAAPLAVAAKSSGQITTITNSHNRRARNQVMISGSGSPML